MGIESSNHSGGASAQRIIMNVDEMHEIMNYIAKIHLSFQDVVNPKLAELAATKYFEGGESSKALARYPEFMKKATQVSALYGQAYSDVVSIMVQWLEQDRVLAEAFRNSLASDPEAQANITKLFGG